jgi:sulfotransferase family protein
MRGMAEPQTPPPAPATPAQLPTFFVIGASKCGTTSLHRYLAEHPEIAMTSNKEPMLYVPDDWQEQLGRYAEMFEEDAPVRGESSTGYSAYPWAPEVPDRIRATVRDARIIYMVRDPIPRTLSHYAQNIWDRFPVRPFDELMTDLEDPMNMPVWASRYATQLERWLERFPQDQVLVADQADLMHSRAETMRRVFAFLGVDTGFRSPSWDEEHNIARARRVPTKLGKRLGARRGVGDTVSLKRRLATREVVTPTLRPDQRERLVAILEPEVARLRALTGLPFDRWSL